MQKSLVVLALYGLGSMSVLAAPPAAPHRLDLRLPSALAETVATKTASFPSLLHPQLAGAREEERFAGLSASMQTPASSRIEEIARRVRREGVPVARLWENHSALVSLGLNQRGKPGLWVVQKVH